MLETLGVRKAVIGVAQAAFGEPLRERHKHRDPRSVAVVQRDMHTLWMIYGLLHTKSIYKKSTSTVSLETLEDRGQTQPIGATGIPW